MRHRALSCILSALLVTVLLSAVAGPLVAVSGFGGFSLSERRLLSTYFELYLAAAAIRPRLMELEAELEALHREADQLRHRLESAHDEYVQARGRTGAALRWVHRMGPTSYLDVLLGAASLRDLLRRTELVTAAARGALAALADIQRDKAALDHVRDELVRVGEEIDARVLERDELMLVEEERRREAESLAASFGERWPEVEAEMETLVTLWVQEAYPYLEELPARFLRLADSEIIPPWVVIYPSLLSVRAVVPAAGLNAILDGDSSLRGATFHLIPDQAKVEVEELLLTVTGTLSVDRGLIRYRVTAVELGGLPMPRQLLPASLEDLSLDLRSALEGMTPRSITVREDEMELVAGLFR